MSKRLSWLLRHGAAGENMEIARDGSVRVDDVLRRRDFSGLTFDGLRWLVDSSDKRRFELLRDDAGIWRVRAVQGWTDHVGEAIDDSVAMQEIRTAKELDQLGYICCHGTWLESWAIIKVQGLRRMTRKHIHFACHAPSVGEVISGMRTECEVLIFLDTEKFLAAGGKLYRSKNNVLLTDGFEGVIPPEFFKRAVQRRPKTGQLWPDRGQSGHIPGMAPSGTSGSVIPRPPHQPAPTVQAAHATKRWDRTREPLLDNSNPIEEDSEKKAKRLAKILAGIERTEEKQRQGQNLTQEELDKVMRRLEIERELQMLRSGPATRPAVADAWDDQPMICAPPVESAPVPDSWDDQVEDSSSSVTNEAAATTVEKQPNDVTMTSEDGEKRTKRLAKTLAGIEKLEEKRQQGQVLSREEADKVRRKGDVERELRELRESHASATTREATLVTVTEDGPASATSGKKEAAAAKTEPRGRKWRNKPSG